MNGKIEKAMDECPFCGTENIGTWADGLGKSFQHMCCNDDCPVQPSTSVFDSPEEAAGAWNTRAYLERLLDPDMPQQELRLHMGEVNYQETLVARAAIRWANSRIFRSCISKTAENDRQTGLCNTDEEQR